MKLHLWQKTLSVSGNCDTMKTKCRLNRRTQNKDARSTCPLALITTRIIHQGLSRKRADVKPGGILVQYVERLNSETARHSLVSALAAETS